MLIHKFIFNPKKLQKRLEKFAQINISNIEEKKAILSKWSNLGEILMQTKESALQGIFLEDIFAKVLGYKNIIESPSEYNLAHEKTVLKDATEADGALGYFSEDMNDIRIIIELKNAKTDLDTKQRRIDRRTPIEQAFSYAHKSGKNCKWVIVSNFKEIRLYNASSSIEYESFRIKDLIKDIEFIRFYYLLSKRNLITKHNENLIDVFYRENADEKDNISQKFYNEYKYTREVLFEHLKENNQINKIKENKEENELILLEKTQKLLDRIIFIFFCEAQSLLPDDTFHKLIKIAKESFDDDKDKIWQQLKGLFNLINVGSESHRISKFNGGLFATDIRLNNLIIHDIIFDKILKLYEYDFESDLDVNILGHIFEQSISDLEEMRAGILAKDFNEKKGKRKKEGIYYTPEYITHYIIEEAIGGWLEDQKQEIGYDDLIELTEEDYKSIKVSKGKLKTNKNIKKHIEFWESYKDELMNIKILDPACGSGAFLNQAFDFLYNEGQKVNNILAKLKAEQKTFFDFDTHILQNNLYGVDLNFESVEITKLSLWIKTAKIDKELTFLEHNIKCGNSLIDDSKIAGKKIFKWKIEFEEIMNNGGFDIVISNPPYVDIKALDNTIVKYFFDKYETTANRINLYSIFIEKASNLIKNNSYLSFIIPNSILINSSYLKIRKHLINGIKKIVKLPDDVFESAKVETIIIVFKKNAIIPIVQTIFYHKNENENGIDNAIIKKINKKTWFTSESLIFNIYIDKNIAKLLSKFKENFTQLNKIADFSLGITPYDKYNGHSEEIIKNRKFHSKNQIDLIYKPLISGENIIRYYIKPHINEYIRYGDWLGAPREERFFTEPRIIIRQIISGNPPRIYAGYSKTLMYFTQIAFGIIPKEKEINPKYLLTLLNSKLINFIHKYTFLDLEKQLFQKILISNCKKLPIKIIDIESQKPFITKANLMLEKNKELYEASNKFLKLLREEFFAKDDIKISKKLRYWYKLDWNGFKEELKKKKIRMSLKEKSDWIGYLEEGQAKILSIKSIIDKIDKEIDKMVYDLYGLTEEEINIIEEN